MIRVLALCLAAATAGCATVEYRRTPLADRVPAQLLECQPQPTPGALDRQSDVAHYVVDLAAAGEDCRGKVAAVRQVVEADKGE